jgi:hypothetical protein
VGERAWLLRSRWVGRVEVADFFVLAFLRHGCCDLVRAVEIRDSIARIILVGLGVSATARAVVRAIGLMSRVGSIHP